MHANNEASVMTRKQSMSTEVETIGKLTLNIFLLFLTGGQTLLLPWLPLVLRGVGMEPMGIGATLGLAGLVSSLSGYLFLRAIRRTRSGAMRRVLLLFLLLISAIFFFTSALVASPPSAAFSRSCRLEDSLAGDAIPPSGKFDEFFQGLLPVSVQDVPASSPPNTSSSSPSPSKPPETTSTVRAPVTTEKTADKETTDRNLVQVTPETATQKSTTSTVTTTASSTSSSTPENNKSLSTDESSSSESNTSSRESIPSLPGSVNQSILTSEVSHQDISSSFPANTSSFSLPANTNSSSPLGTTNFSTLTNASPSLVANANLPNTTVVTPSLTENNPPSPVDTKTLTTADGNQSMSTHETSSPDIVSDIDGKAKKHHSAGKAKTKGVENADDEETVLSTTSDDFDFFWEPEDDDANSEEVEEVVPGESVSNGGPEGVEEVLPGVSVLNEGRPGVSVLNEGPQGGEEFIPRVSVLNEGLPQSNWDMKQLRENFREHLKSLDSKSYSPVMNMQHKSPHLPVPDHAFRKTPDDTHRKIPGNAYRKIPGDMYKKIPENTYRKIPDTTYKKKQDIYKLNDDRFPVDYDALFHSYPGLHGVRSRTYSDRKAEANGIGMIENADVLPVPKPETRVRAPLRPPQGLPTGLRHSPHSNSYHKVHRGKRKAVDLSSTEESVTTDVNTTDASPDVEGDLKDSSGISVHTMMSAGHLYGAAVLVVLAYAFGACIEYLVLKLRHCYTHGYDEVSREPMDIIERTITYTFDFSMYGTHKSWSNLTSSVMVFLAAAVLASACSLKISLAPPLVSLATMYFCLMGLALLSLMCVTVPYGSIDAPRTKRALSLYLDNEVLREGIRRLSFHSYVGVCGFATSLLFSFSLLLLEGLATSPGVALMTQAITVAAWLIGEGLTVPVDRWFAGRLGILGLMGTSLWMLSFLLVLLWATSNPWIMAPAHALLGFSKALIWMAVKHNSLLLATISDQEGEVTVSWWVWRLSSSVGAAVWGAALGRVGLLSHLFIPAAAITAFSAAIVVTTAIATRSERRSKRRVYHTLDLSDESEEEDFSSQQEDDWLVKRASKEGITL